MVATLARAWAHTRMNVGQCSSCDQLVCRGRGQSQNGEMPVAQWHRNVLSERWRLGASLPHRGVVTTDRVPQET
jgi:hypothetical protein